MDLSYLSYGPLCSKVEDVVVVDSRPTGGACVIYQSKKGENIYIYIYIYTLLNNYDDSRHNIYVHNND